jgi:RND family efflux transporter MFP subunit
MKKYALIFLTSILILSCSKTEEGAKKQGNMPDTPAPSVKIEVVQPKMLQLYAEITGKLEGITDIVYYSEVSGKVKSINKRLGDQVKKGEAIAYLDSQNYRISYDQTNSELKSAEANLDALRIKLESTQKLFESGKVSKFELTNDQSALKKAEAAVEGARAGVERARLNYENSKFISPVDGSIAQINIKEGQFVATGQAVASIVDCAQLLIKTGLTENDIVSIRNGSPVEVRHNGEEKIVTGKVTGFGKRPDATGNYPVEILIENKNRELLPGMIVRGKIESTRLEGIIYTDFDNIVEEFGKYFVYVISPDNKAEKRQVTIGKKYGNMIIINSGLNPGDKMVVSGVDMMTNGIEVRIFGQMQKNEK